MIRQVFIAVLGAGIVSVVIAQAVNSMVSLEAAREALDKSTASVIDIREPSEHATGVAQGAKLIPMSQWAARGWPMVKLEAN